MTDYAFPDLGLAPQYRRWLDEESNRSPATSPARIQNIPTDIYAV